MAAQPRVTPIIQACARQRCCIKTPGIARRFANRCKPTASANQQLDCAQGAALVGSKLAEVEQKMTNLQQLRDFLRSEKLSLETSTAEQIAKSGEVIGI